jgi:hypothetical protein
MKKPVNATQMNKTLKHYCSWLAQCRMSPLAHLAQQNTVSIYSCLQKDMLSAAQQPLRAQYEFPLTVSAVDMLGEAAPPFFGALRVNGNG